MISVGISRRKEIVIRLPQFVKVNPSSTMMPLTNRLHYFLSVHYRAVFCECMAEPLPHVVAPATKLYLKTKSTNIAILAIKTCVNTNFKFKKYLLRIKSCSILLEYLQVEPDL